MKFKSTLLGPASGSLAGSTFSRNRGGQYVRTRATPINPNTPRQLAVRFGFNAVIQRWVNVLSQQQRNGWKDYAREVQLPDAFGDPRNPGGLGMYVRGNVPRLQAGLAVQDDPPGIFDLGIFSAFSIAGSTPPNQIDVEFEDTDPWVSEDGAALLIFVSERQNQTINFYKGPFVFAAAVLGDSAAPPTSPQTITVPVVLVAGLKHFVRARVSYADGRLTTDTIVQLTPA